MRKSRKRLPSSYKTIFYNAVCCSDVFEETKILDDVGSMILTRLPRPNDHQSTAHDPARAGGARRLLQNATEFLVLQRVVGYTVLRNGRRAGHSCKLKPRFIRDFRRRRKLRPQFMAQSWLRMQESAGAPQIPASLCHDFLASFGAGPLLSTG